jgi:hypothetical protein
MHIEFFLRRCHEAREGDVMIPLQCTQGSRLRGWKVVTGGSGLCLLAGFTISTVKPSRPDITVPVHT